MFGKLRRQQRLTEAARDVQVQLAGLSDLDRASLRAALDTPGAWRAPVHTTTPKPPARRRRRSAAMGPVLQPRPLTPPAPMPAAAPAAPAVAGGRLPAPVVARAGAWLAPPPPAVVSLGAGRELLLPPPPSVGAWAAPKRAFAALTAPVLAPGARPLPPPIAVLAPPSAGTLPVPVSTDPAAMQVTDDTMLVVAPQAWDLYRRTAAYICEPGRAFRPVRYVAFFLGNVLQREVPRIIAVRDAVPFDAREQRRLMDSGTELDLRLAEVIATARQFGVDGEHQVYLLTAPGQPGHVRLGAPVTVRERRWRSKGLSPKMHYTSVDTLCRARSR